ncbi:expressed unknown protein [Seminavis robusta]|uniref:Uncharacterized protein n=1 Tax=Seminavis robusta TaxID=568900 RepID=A0A9N8HDE7_9STRA|nr:expressed unknown protein [Seminavis robusta]|eukprot:Sro424_g140040.1 n/a (106) ;mRNA; f:66311-66628
MSWFTSFDKIVGSTRASFRVSLKVLGGGVKRIQRAASLSSARLDLLDDMSSSSSSSSSSGSVVIEKKDNVLTSGNFTVETCSNSVPASQELVSQNSLSFLQMRDD